MFDWHGYLTALGKWIMTSGLRVLIILIVMLVAIKIARVIADNLFRRWRIADDIEMKKRADTLAGILRQVLSLSVLLLGFVLILGEFGVNLGPIIAAAGIVGLAVGFGAQNLVKDVISGFFILLDDQIRVGDVVDIGKAGLVEEVGLRLTKLRSLDGSVHYVRNGEISIVTNMTKGFSYYVFDIGVAYRENVDEVIGIMKEVDEDLRKDPKLGPAILAPIEVFGLDKFADSAVIIKARIKTLPIRQWDIGREFNRRLKIAFDERGIEIPFPHLTLYMGERKDGTTPPVPIHIQPPDNSA